MARIRFTDHLKRHLSCEDGVGTGDTVMAVLEDVLRDQQTLAGYVLDDQGRLRKHVTVFVNGHMVRDRLRLGDAVGPDDEIYVMQALSGG